MAETRDVIGEYEYENSIGDFLDRKGAFSPITKKKLEVIRSTVASYVDEYKELDSSKSTPDIGVDDLKTSATVDLPKSSISEKVQQILEEESYSLGYSAYFQSLQQWLGHVTEIDQESNLFTAKLQDLSSPGTYEIAEFEIRDIPEGDLDLLKIGAAFYWSLGYNYNRSQKTKQSAIRFQRLNDWTEEEYDNAIDKANELYQFLTK